ncbi:MAG: hypothetical protein ACKKMP_00860 [Candidatus Nealsonbacteria bacterium]
MDFWDVVIFVIIPSGIVSAIVGGLVTHFSNKKLDFQRRIMEMRKEVYTEVHELFQGLYNTASSEERSRTTAKLLKYYREVQMWGSDEVIRKFAELLKAIDIKTETSQEKKDLIYKEFVIAMRKDVLGKTGLSPEEIDVYGKIS